MQGRKFEIVSQGNYLGIKSGNGVPWTLYFTTDSDFFVKESKGMARFRFSPDGKVTGFFLNGVEAKKVE